MGSWTHAITLTDPEKWLFYERCFQVGKLLCVLLICFWAKTGALVFGAPTVPISPVSIICCYLVIFIFSMHSQPELFIITSWLALRRILLPHLPPLPFFYVLALLVCWEKSKRSFSALFRKALAALPLFPWHKLHSHRRLCPFREEIKRSRVT